MIWFMYEMSLLPLYKQNGQNDNFFTILLSASYFGSRGRCFRLPLLCSSCRRQTVVAESLAKAIRRLGCPRVDTALKSSCSILWIAGSHGDRKGGRFLESSAKIIFIGLLSFENPALLHIVQGQTSGISVL